MLICKLWLSFSVGSITIHEYCFVIEFLYLPVPAEYHVSAVCICVLIASMVQFSNVLQTECGF